MDSECEKLICDYCGTNIDVDYCIDPYMQDVWGKEEYINVCLDCYTMLCWEI